MKEFDDVKAIKEFVGWELGDLDGQVLLIKSGKDQGLHVHGWYKDANDNIVMRNKILLKSQYTIYRNWLHLLHEYAENPDYFTFLGVNLRLVDLVDLETKYEKYKEVCKNLCVNPEGIETFGEPMTHDWWINKESYKVQSKNRDY